MHIVTPSRLSRFAQSCNAQHNGACRLISTVTLPMFCDTRKPALLVLPERLVQQNMRSASPDHNREVRGSNMRSVSAHSLIRHREWHLHRMQLTGGVSAVPTAALVQETTPWVEKRMLGLPSPYEVACTCVECATFILAHLALQLGPTSRVLLRMTRCGCTYSQEQTTHRSNGRQRLHRGHAIRKC